MKQSLRILARVTAVMVVAGWVSLPFSSGGEVPANQPGQQMGRRQRPGRPVMVGPMAPQPGPQPVPLPSAPVSKPLGAGSRLELIRASGGADTINIEVYGVDIDHLLRLLSYAAKVTIIKSDAVQGPVTIIAPEPVPLDVAFQILDSVLQVKGFTMIMMPTGVYKVLPIADATSPPISFGPELQGFLPPGDEIITQVIPLTNLSATDIATQLQPLLSPNANIVPTSTNSIIITDSAANIHRALAVIENSENELSGGLKVYRLQYYDATEMAGLVSSIVLGRGGGGGIAAAGARPTWERRAVGRVNPRAAPGAAVPRVQLPTAATAAGAMGAGPEFAYPDTRTNSLIVLAIPLHRRQIEDLVTQLDRPVSLRDSYFVYPVQNLIASQLAAAIAPLIGAEVTRVGAGEAGGKAGAGAGTSQQRRQSGYTSPFSATGTASRASSASSLASDSRARGLELEPLSGEGSPARSADPFMIAQAPEVGVAAPVQVAPQPERPVGSETPPTGEMPATTYVSGGTEGPVLVADDNTNTLLISASPEQIDLIEDMLGKLDVLPPQVHIRAIIAEVALSRDTSLGFQWESLGRTWGSILGNTFTGDIGTNIGVDSVVRGNTGTVTSRPSGFFATLSGKEFSAVLNALTSDSRSRILSAPSVFTTSNQAARIDISQQIPIPTGTFQTTTGAATVSTSIGYRSVGIVLDVTPRVTQGNIVQMEISISADEPGAEVIVADLAYPSINQRLAQATVSVMNGYTVVLGGLMRESIIHTADRVPLLGDLPLIGPLFSSTRSTKTKSELLLFLTPFVVRNPAELAEISDRERNRLWEVPKSLKGHLVGPGQQEPPVYEQPPVAPEAEAPATPEQEMQAPEAAPEQAPESSSAGVSPALTPEAAPAPTPAPATPEPVPPPPTPPTEGAPSPAPAPQQPPA